MITECNKDDLHFGLAYELAYFIHLDKDTACFVAEDALDHLHMMLGKHETLRTPSRLLGGFFKRRERRSSVRRTIKLNELQMLQWLVYHHSESWERETEKCDGLYSPIEEDMIVRYLKHLVFITLRPGSFYVNLAVGQFLHQFDLRQTRLLCDILTQTDSARMKCMGYIGKQRLELLRKIDERFDGMIHTLKTPRGERQIVTQPTSQYVFELANECLRRFTPWETDCIIESGFDATDISELYYSGADTDEDRLEMDRIHTVVDPDCFARLLDGLRRYARDLPDDSVDKGCHFDSSSQLAIPAFLNFSNAPSRGHRHRPPALTKADYIRLRRTLDARSRRRKRFTPDRLFVYVDGTDTQSIDLRIANHVEFSIGPETGVIEVVGNDGKPLTLATLLVEFDRIPIGGRFRDEVVLEGGQKTEIELIPQRDASGRLDSAQVLVNYSEPRLTRFMLRPTSEDEPESSVDQRQHLTCVLLTCGLLAAAAIFAWLQLR
jgi:hypothetical protein